MEVKLASNFADLQLISPVLLQLRPQYTGQSLIAQIQQQQLQGYQIAYVIAGDKVLSVAGFLIGTKLAWQKHLYVDDLVTDGNMRSTGAGKFLLDWLQQYAREQGCQQFHLDSGVNRFGAHRFYLREGFIISSHHFAKTDLHADSN